MMPVLDDGSSFFRTSTPLPRDHWLYSDRRDVPPMPFRIGNGVQRGELAALVSSAARYAIRASTKNGQEPDFDPDAMVKNFVIGLMGYWTDDGLNGNPGCDPDPVPPRIDEMEC